MMKRMFAKRRETEAENLNQDAKTVKTSSHSKETGSQETPNSSKTTPNKISKVNKKCEKATEETVADKTEQNFEEKLFLRFSRSDREAVDGIIEDAMTKQRVKLEKARNSEMDSAKDNNTNDGNKASDEIKLSVRAISERKNWVWDLTDTNSKTVTIWSIISVYAVLYNFIFIITRLCFERINNDYYYLWLSLDIITDILYLADIFLQQRSTFLYQGLTIVELAKTKHRYFITFAFKLDIISLLPLDYSLYGIKGICKIFRDTENLKIFDKQIILICRFNRLFKFATITKSFERIEKRTNMPNAVRIMRLCLYIAIIIHWNACIFFLICESMTLGSDGWVFGGSDERDLNTLLLDSVASGQSMVTNSSYNQFSNALLKQLSLHVSQNQSFCGQNNPSLLCLAPIVGYWDTFIALSDNIDFSLTCNQGLSYQLFPKIDYLRNESFLTISDDTINLNVNSSTIDGIFTGHTLGTCFFVKFYNSSY